jgi:FMN phosphatase YigB (HAD superfamily)
MNRLICSFDIFDTLLTRCVFHPSDLFLLLGHRLQKLGLVKSAEEFLRKRVLAEQEARSQTTREEVTLSEIYCVLARLFSWSLEQSERAMQEELLCEKRSLTPIAPMIRVMEKVAGARMLAISDTYLPEEFVAEQLRIHIPIDNWGLYVSSSVGLTKHSGRLFEYIIDREQMAHTKWQHWGDNPYSDLSIPRRFGIETQPPDYESVTRYESAVANNLPRMLASTLSGCMRATRLSRCFDSTHYQDVWNIASDVVGPVFLGFCYWLLSSACRDRVQRLYFVARDGQILLRLTRKIQEACPEFSGIECKYLYGSRQAWHLPAISQVDEEVLDWIFANTSFLSVNIVLERLGQAKSELPSPVYDAIASCVPPERWTYDLSQSERLALRQVFEQSKEIHRWILGSSAQARESVLAYLSQEGLMDGTGWAMVDIGWHGRLQNSLSRLLSLAGCSPQNGTLGYYWGLVSRTPYQSQDRQIALADELPRAWRPILFYHAGLYEAFASADHGSTIGYSKSDIMWVPVLRDSTASGLIEWGVSYLQEGAVAFADNFLRNWQGVVDIQEYMSLALLLLKQFFFEPTHREVACLQARPMYECQTEFARLNLIPESSAWGIIRYWIRGEPYPDHGIWPHAVIARQPLYLRPVFRCVLRWNKFLVLAGFMIRRVHPLVLWRAMREKIARHLQIIRQ